MCPCVQILWRKIYEVHDLCMSVWTVFLTKLLTCWWVCTTLVNGVSASECHYHPVLGPFGQLLVAILFRKEFDCSATYWSISHIVRSPLLKKNCFLCFFYLIGYYSKEIPCHYRAYLFFFNLFSYTSFFLKFLIKMFALSKINVLISLLSGLAEKCPDTRYVKIILRLDQYWNSGMIQIFKITTWRIADTILFCVK